MLLIMSRRKQSNPKPLKCSEMEEAVDTTITSPGGDRQGLDGNVDSGGHSPDTGASPEPDGRRKASKKVTWPVSKGIVLGPFSARIEPLEAEFSRENSICVRGTSGTVFSIFILEYYCEEFLSRNNIKPVTRNGLKAAVVYIFKPDKQLYLLTLRDIEEHDHIHTVFLEGGQDHHPELHEVSDIIDQEVSRLKAQQQQQMVEGHHSVAGQAHSSLTPGEINPKDGDCTSRNNLADVVKDAGEGVTLCCKACGVKFRNPSNLNAHQLYYCSARETVPVMPCVREYSTSRVVQQNITESSRHLTEMKDTGHSDSLVCILCKARFTNKTNCLSHMITLHTEQNSQACKCCNFMCTDIEFLKEHMLIHVRGTGINAAIVTIDKRNAASSIQNSIMQYVSSRSEILDRRQDEKRKKRRSHHNNSCDSTGSGSPSDSIITSTDSNGKDSSSNSKHTCRQSDGHDADDETEEDKSSNARKKNVEDDKCSESLSPNTDNVLSPSCGILPKSPTSNVSRSSLQSSGKDESSCCAHQLRPVGRFLCVECDIYFSNHKNFIAHKQYYCQGHAKERKKIQHSAQPVPSGISLVQCGDCAAVFPSREKLAVHTLYFCQCRGTSGAHLPSSSARPGDEEGSSSSVSTNHSGSTNGNERKQYVANPSSSSAHKIKVQSPTENSKSFQNGVHVNISNDRVVTPTSISFNPSISPAAVPTGPILLAPGRLPTYIGKQGASPVYILASHVFVTPSGVPGSGEEPTSSASSHFLQTISVGNDVSSKSDNRTSIPTERPLDLSIRKRKGSEEVIKQESGASKVTKSANDDVKLSPSPTSTSPHLVSVHKTLAPVTVPSFTGPVQYQCPGCHIVFNRLESLEVHQKYYCQSSSSNDGNRPTAVNGQIISGVSTHLKSPPLAAPFFQIVSNQDPPSGSTLVPALATVQLKDDVSRPTSRDSNIHRTGSKDDDDSSPSAMANSSVPGSRSPTPAAANKNHKDATPSKAENDHLPLSPQRGTEKCLLKEEDSGGTAADKHNGIAAHLSPTCLATQKKIPNGQPEQSSSTTVKVGGQGVAVHVPMVVRYMCPTCGVSFMKVASLTAHQQFYCTSAQINAAKDTSHPTEIIRGHANDSGGAGALSRVTLTQDNGSAVTNGQRGVHSEEDGDNAMDTDEMESLSMRLPNHTHGFDNHRDAKIKERKADTGDETRVSTPFSDTICQNEALSDHRPCIVIKQEKETEENSACCAEVKKCDNLMKGIESKVEVKKEKPDTSSSCSINCAAQESESGKCSDDISHSTLSSQNGHKRTACGPGVSDVTEGEDKNDSTGAKQTTVMRVVTNLRHSVGSSSGTSSRPTQIMMKHCRACNISFSSLSTFIAHKKYYCASHHLTKNSMQ